MAYLWVRSVLGVAVGVASVVVVVAVVCVGHDNVTVVVELHPTEDQPAMNLKRTQITTSVTVRASYYVPLCNSRYRVTRYITSKLGKRSTFNAFRDVMTVSAIRTNRKILQTRGQHCIESKRKSAENF